MENLNSDDFITSIKATTRTVRNVMVSFLSLDRHIVVDIIRKFATNISYLRVCAGRATDLIEAIELVPDVVHLELILLSDFSSGDDKPPQSKKARPDETRKPLNLLKLKKLNIGRCNHEFLDMFNRLPVDVLVDLTLDRKCMGQLANVFRTQTKIKNLTIVNHVWGREHATFDAHLLDALRMESLEWHEFTENTMIESILAKQANLKTLKLINGYLNTGLFNVLTHQLSKLEKLSIAVSASTIAVADFKDISKLENLQELILQSKEEKNVELLNEFAKLDNSRITSMTIQHCCRISDNLIGAMATSLPNLKKLNFHCEYNINTFHGILKHFNSVETLHLDTFDTSFSKHDRKGNYVTLMDGGCRNSNLTELKICYPIRYTVKLIEKMAVDYPHLRKLVILPPIGSNRNFIDQFEAILKCFKELDSLSILKDDDSFDRRFYDLDLIEKYGTKIKFVAFLDMDMDCLKLESIENQFRRRFGAIRFSRTEGLCMADGRETMAIEWEDLNYCR